MISQLQDRARATGSFVDRAIAREIKMAFTRAAGTPAITELVHLAEAWEAGTPDVQVLDAIRRINRSAASCWKADAPRAGS
jgi:hypothetical protein